MILTIQQTFCACYHVWISHNVTWLQVLLLLISQPIVWNDCPFLLPTPKRCTHSFLLISPEHVSLRHSFLRGHVVNYHSYSYNGMQVPALWNVFKICSSCMMWISTSWCHNSLQRSACAGAYKLSYWHEKWITRTNEATPWLWLAWVACIAVAWGIHHLSPFWGRILWWKICAHWCLCTQLPELQLQLWLANLFLDGTRFLWVNIKTQLMYWIIVTCNQMMSFDFVIQLTCRLIGPRGVLCHPDQHGAMVSSSLQSKSFGQEATMNIHKIGIYLPFIHSGKHLTTRLIYILW